jgi:uncharacterized protein
MRLVLAVFAIVACLLFAMQPSRAETRVSPLSAPAPGVNIEIPTLTGRVVDQTATLSNDQAATLERKLRDFEKRKGSQVAVLIVPTTLPESIEQYSLRVANQWKLGRKNIDDGVLLTIAMNDRKLRIEVGYGLVAVLDDFSAKRIIDEVIVPRFKLGNFAEGVSEGVDRILEAIDAAPVPATNTLPGPKLPQQIRRSQYN